MKSRIAAITLFSIITNLLSAVPYIRIGELELFRATTAADSNIGLREYLPKGESLDHWNRLASVRIFKDLKDPKKYLLKVAALARNGSPVDNSRLMQDDKTQAYVLDFLAMAPDQPFVEWNLMRAQYVKGTGLIVFQYAMRIYNATPNSLGALKAERNKMTRAFVDAQFEEALESNRPPEPAPSAVH